MRLGKGGEGGSEEGDFSAERRRPQRRDEGAVDGEKSQRPVENNPVGKNKGSLEVFDRS